MSGVEIERKFLVRKGDAYKRVAFSCTHIQQGYIPAEGATVRVRVRDDHADLTIKSRSQDGGLSRYEFEKEITLGEARKDDIVYRSGAKDTDLICVSGDLGAAYMGLQLLEREKSVYYQQVDEARKKNDKHALEELRNFQPDFAGKEYLLQRQLQTEARGDIIAQFRELGIRPTAMMDISDGLSSELMHICKESGCGCRIYEKNIPIDYQTAVMAEEMNMNVTTCALNGGEDYELLFTVPIGDNEKIQQMDNVKLIGHITRPELGQMLVTRDNQEFELKAQGWNPLSKEE